MLFIRARNRVSAEPTDEKRRCLTVKTRRDFDGAVSRFMKARDALEEAKSDHAAAWEELMEIGIDKWASHSKKEGRPAGTLTLKTKFGSNVRIIPTSRFTKMNETTANMLRKEYPDLIEEQTTYSFNQTILKRHMEEISRLIEKSRSIPQEDKDRLFTATSTFPINKTHIGSDMRFADKAVCQDLGRVFMLKCPKTTE